MINNKIICKILLGIPVLITGAMSGIYKSKFLESLQ